MVKKEEKIEKVEEEVTDSRQSAWEAFLVKAEKANPVKFAAKKAKGEFDKIPVSFKG